jgi:hypothetical protein
MPQNLLRISDFQNIAERRRLQRAAAAPVARGQCVSENCDGYRCQGETGHPGPHFLLGSTVNGVWADEAEPPRSA